MAAKKKDVLGLVTNKKTRNALEYLRANTVSAGWVTEEESARDDLKRAFLKLRKLGFTSEQIQEIAASAEVQP